jgi:carboxyl-terminal processing protease
MKIKLLSVFTLMLAGFLLCLGLFQLQLTPFVHAAKQDDRFNELENFSQALSIIKSKYVEDVTDTELLRGAVKGMLSELDPHSFYFTAEQYKTFMVDVKGEFGGLGMTIGMRSGAITVIAPMEDTPAYNAGILSGDIIYKINSTVTTGMSTEEAVKLMRGKPGTNVTITVIRKNADEPLVFDLTRDIIKVKAVNSEMFDNNIGYLKLISFQENSGEALKTALKSFEEQDMKGIILDLRGNPGGALSEAINVASLFLPSGKVVVSTRERTGKPTTLTAKSMDYLQISLPLVVIVDEGSASASEIVAGAIQDHNRGIIVGVPTFGKASVQTLIELRDGAYLKLTTAKYYTPNERSIQGIGIIPDVEVQKGTIVYSSSNFSVKEKDLSGHLRGENEENPGASKTTNTSKPAEEDLQLNTAIQLVKGLTLFSRK